MRKAASVCQACMGLAHASWRAACFILSLCLVSAAHAELSIDKRFGEVSGWTIGFSEGISGCLAAAKYKDGTTVWLGFGDKAKAYIAFTNPNWKSIERDGLASLPAVSAGSASLSASNVKARRAYFRVA